MMFREDTKLPKSPSSEDLNSTKSKRSSKDFEGIPFDEQVNTLTPKENKESKERKDEKLSKKDEEKLPKKSKEWVPYVEKTYGLVVTEDFFDGLSDNETIDISELVALVAPVLAQVQTLNPTFAMTQYLAKDIRYEAPRDGDTLMLECVLHHDRELTLKIPDEYEKSVERQLYLLEGRREEIVRVERDWQESRRRKIATGLKAKEGTETERIELGVKVLDAYIRKNPRVTALTQFGLYETLGVRMSESGAKDAPSVSQILHEKFPEALIPEGIDPVGAKLQDKENELAKQERERAEKENDKIEDPLFEKQKKLRNEKQQENSKLLVKGSQALHGKLEWCKSGFDTRGDVRLEQESHKGKTVDNAFARWVRCNSLYDKGYEGEPAPEPDKGDFMNCWEGVIYAAYKAGLLTKEAIVKAYLGFRRDQDTDGALMKWLGYDKSCLFKKGRREPEVGDILFYGFNEHVAIYKGDGKVLQLWHDGRASEVYEHVLKKDSHRESDWEELEQVGHDIRFAPSPF